MSKRGRKSQSCFDPQSGEALLEFDRRSDATRAVKFDPLESRQMNAYLCPKCEYWHLRSAPEQSVEQVDDTCLKCVGRDGMPKVLHATYEAALEVALATAGVKLTVYACPEGRGWHLTKG